MRHATLVSALILLAACSGEPSDRTSPVDIGNAAAEAQGSVDNYAALPDDTQTPDASPATSPAPSAPAAPATPDASPDTVEEAPFTPDSAQGAADVVQTYYASIERGRYRQAWRLWGDGGRASGMGADAFAASFAKYAEYHATVGAPGRIDAGAGQRYVTVPVKVYGRLKDGNRRFAMEGPVTLHRVADIDGATAEQRAWRISASGVRPRPAATEPTPAPTAPPAVTARYSCDRQVTFTASFDHRADTAALRFADGVRATLAGQRPASGIWYKGGGYELRGKGRSADLTRPRGPTLSCTADR